MARRALLTLVILVWGSPTLMADWYAAQGVFRAVRSGGWVTADGVVTRSELRHGRRGAVSLDLTYTFTVGSREYTGHDYEPDPSYLTQSRRPRVQAALPAGTPVTVYHDPNDPADAVIDPGVKPVELALLLSLVPFNTAAAGLLLAGWRAVTRRRRFDPARHVRPTADGLAARLNGLTRLECFGIALFGLSIAGTVGVVVLLHECAETPPSWWLDGGTWVVILAVSGLAAWQGGRPRELVERLNTFTLPATSTGWEMVEVTRASVVNVEVQVEKRQARRGPYEVFVLALVLSGGDHREVRFAEYPDRRDADGLAGWLRERVAG